jgi:fatty-acyl-CoA synthase
LSTLEHLHAVLRMHQIGIVNLLRPDKLIKAAGNNAKIGPQAALTETAANDHPDLPALTDERGTWTYRQFFERSNALAHALRRTDLPPKSVIGVLARDHRGLALAITGTARAGLRLAMLNTGLAAPQLAELIKRENIRFLMYDSEFAPAVDLLPPDIPRYLSWVDDGYERPAGVLTVDELTADEPVTVPLPIPEKPGGFIILTSGTTGLPKGAPRTKVSPLASAVIADRVDFPRQGTAVIASPLFHTTGFGAWTVGLSLANHAVLLRRLSAESVLAAIAEHRPC